MPVYDALLDSSVKHVLCRHEQGAAFAAIGYARSSRQTAVCIATSGPGATNLITALADAMMDSVPVVAITGQVPLDAIGTDAFQEIDVLGLSMACTKHSFMVRDPGHLCSILQQAFEIACSGRPGPVLVDIPKDIQMSPVNYVPPMELLTNQPEPVMSDDLLAARELLKNARKPVAYIGGGVGMADAVEELQQFLEVTGMPSVCTLKGLGAVNPQDKHYLGMLGMHGTKAANMAVQSADLLIAIGARFDDRVTGKLEKFAPDASIIHMDIDPAEFHKRRRAHVGLSEPLDHLLPQLATPLAIDHWRQHCLEQKEQNLWRYDKPGNDIYAPLLLKQLSGLLPDNAVVSCDVGQHQMWVAQHMRFSRPENHLTSGGLGTMGFGLPAAIGAVLARPDDPVVLVSGDGSFMMNIQELNTLRREQIPLKIVLIDNQKLGMVKQWQELFFDGRYSETDLSDNPEFVSVAKAFGIPGRKIVEKEQVLPALQEMLSADSSWLLHVCIDERENVWPLVPPSAGNHEMMEKHP